MGRVHPGGASPEDLIAYADDAASVAVIEHVRSCAQCAAEADRYARTQRGLRRALYRFACPSPLLLGDYELGVLSPEDRLHIAEHLRDCPHCGAEAQTLRSFLAREPAPPVGAIERLRRVIATLVDAPLQPAHVGLRGGDDDEVQTFRAGAITITIGPASESRRGRVSLVGLIVSEGPGGQDIVGGVARLTGPDGATHTVEIDELGNFVFEGIAPGAYRLEIQLADQILLVEDLQVRG